MGHVALASAVCTIKVIQGFLSLSLSLYPPPPLTDVQHGVTTYLYLSLYLSVSPPLYLYLSLSATT